MRGKLKCRDHLARKSSRGRKTNTDSGDTSFMEIKMPEPDLEGFLLAISFSYYHRKASKRESFGREGEEKPAMTSTILKFRETGAQGLS